MSVELKRDKGFEEMLPKMAAEEESELRTSIKKEGCREPLVVWNGILIDGYNRYRICQEEKVEFKVVEKKFASRDEAMLWAIRNQLGRRNLTKYARVKLALRMKKMIEKRAAANQKRSPGRPGKGVTNSSPVIPEVKTRKVLAEAAGVSEDTVRKVEIIEKAGTPEERAQMANNEVSINKAFKKVEGRLRAQEEPGESQLQKLPEGQFAVLYCRFPQEPGGEGKGPGIKPDRLKEIEVSSILDDEAAVFIRVTIPMLEDAIYLLNRWGFDYRGNIVLTGEQSSAEDGDTYIRGGHEHLVIGIKGNLVPARENRPGSIIPNVLGPDDVGKPDPMLKVIDGMFPESKKVALFVSGPIPESWTGWPNEPKGV